jgi:hypothetical protein
MKPVLYVALVAEDGALPQGRIGELDLILVTSEDGDGPNGRSRYDRRFYGHAVDGVATSCYLEEMVARFPDLETARKALGKAALAHDAYCSIIERAKRELHNLQETQRFAVRTAILDFAMRGPY